MKLIEIIEQLKNDTAPINRFYNTKWTPYRPNRNKMSAFIELRSDLDALPELYENDNYDGGGVRLWNILYSDLISDDNDWQWFTSDDYQASLKKEYNEKCDNYKYLKSI